MADHYAASPLLHYKRLLIVRGRFSLRTMLGLVAAFGLSLALTRVHFLIGVAVMVLGVLVVAVVGGDARRKRAIIYGALSGVVLFLTVSAAIAWANGERPFRRRGQSRAVVYNVRPYVFPFGAFMGGLAGCLYADWRRPRPEESRPQ